MLGFYKEPIKIYFLIWNYLAYQQQIKSLRVTCKAFVLGAVKGNDEACIVQSKSTKAKNLLFFKKRLSFSCSFFREIVRKLCYLQAKTVCRWRGALNLKIHPQGLLSISFMFQLLQWVEKMLCIFKFYYSFKLQTSYHIYFKFPSMGSPSWASLLCDNSVCRIWQNSTRSCACRFNHIHRVQYDLLYQNSNGSRRGACPPSYFQTKLRLEGPTNFFLETSFSPAPNPLPPLSQGLDPALQNTGVCPQRG